MCVYSLMGQLVNSSFKAVLHIKLMSPQTEILLYWIVFFIDNFYMPQYLIKGSTDFKTQVSGSEFSYFQSTEAAGLLIYMTII